MNMDDRMILVPSRCFQLLVSLFLLLPVGALAQINRYAVVLPSLVTSGEYAGDRDISIASFFGDGRLETLPESPRLVCGQTYKEFDPVTTADGFGGLFLLYSIEHNDPAHQGDRDIVMRRLDRNFNDMLGDSARPLVPVAQSKYRESNPIPVPLPDGSLLVVYELDDVNAGDTGNVDVAAVRVARDGSLVWNAGAWVANSGYRERIAGAVADGRGGAIVVLEVVTSREGAIPNSDIVAVHIDGQGKTGWQSTAKPVAIGASRHIERNPAVVSDGYGGLYVAYEVEYTSGERTGDIDILAQHLSSVGMREWTNEEMPPIVSSDSRAREHHPILAYDNTSLTVAFLVDFMGDSSRVIGVQRMDLLGKAVWNNGTNALLLSAEHGLPERPLMISDHLGGVYLLAESRDSSGIERDIYGQRITADGVEQWGEGAALVPLFDTPDLERDPAIVVEATGDIVVTAVRDTFDATNRKVSTVIAQKFGHDGAHRWLDLNPPLIVAKTDAILSRPLLLVTP